MRKVFYILSVHSLTFHKAHEKNIQAATVLLKCHSKHINNGTAVEHPPSGTASSSPPKSPFQVNFNWKRVPLLKEYKNRKWVEENLCK